jgi:hypothetical protein
MIDPILHNMGGFPKVVSTFTQIQNRFDLQQASKREPVYIVPQNCGQGVCRRQGLKLLMGWIGVSFGFSLFRLEIQECQSMLMDRASD